MDRINFKNIGHSTFTSYQKKLFYTINQSHKIELNQSKQYILAYTTLFHIFKFTSNGNKNHLEKHFENHFIACLFLKSLNFLKP